MSDASPGRLPDNGRYAGLFSEEPPEGRWPVVDIDGELPSGLRGRWLLAGPAGFRRGDTRFRHWLDGDGFVVSVRFDDSGDGPRAEQTQRFVRTTRRREEQEAGRVLYRAFGTSVPGDRLLHGVTVASAANVSVVPFAGRLLACGEQGRPWELDPETLETRGEWTGGGRLTSVSPFAAHPKTDPRTGELLAFGVSYATAKPSLTLYRFDADGTPGSRTRAPLDAPVSLHDMAITDRSVVFWTSPHRMDVEAMRAGATVDASLRWHPEEESSLMILDRDSGETRARIPIGPGYCLHFVGAHETAEGRLTVDALELDRPVYDLYRPLPVVYPTAARGRPVRLEIDLVAQRCVARTEISGVPAPEFPCIDPARETRPCSRAWCLDLSDPDAPGPHLFDELVELDWKASEVAGRWAAPEGNVLAGEPVFVPDDPEREEDGRPGCLLVPSIALPSRLARLHVLRCGDLASGPVATLSLPARIAYGFHAAWSPD